MIESSRQRFLKQAELCKAHANMVASADFRAALEVALLEYSMQNSRAVTAEAAHWKLQGAHEFARLFCTLSTPPVAAAGRDRDNLD